jgi:archaellum biogenesis ATPase FlaH
MERDVKSFEVYDAITFIEEELDVKESIIEGGILPRDSIAMVGGISKLGKSIFVLNMAIQMAIAKPFLLQFNIPKPQKVIYLQAEISAHSMQDRLKKMLAVTDSTPEKKMLYIVNQKGLKFDKEDDLAKVSDLIQECEANVLIVDPLYKFHSGDENAVKDMTRFFDGLDWIITQNNISIVVVHHFGKPQQGKSGATQFRGSSTITDYADTYMMLNRKSNKETRNSVKLSFELRNEEAPETMILHRNPDTLWYLPTGAVGDSKVSNYTCVECLQQLGGVVANKDKLISAIKEKSKASDKTIKKTLDDAISSGKILTESGKGKGSPKICFLPDMRTKAEELKGG